VQLSFSFRTSCYVNATVTLHLFRLIDVREEYLRFDLRFSEVLSLRMLAVKSRRLEQTQNRYTRHAGRTHRQNEACLARAATHEDMRFGRCLNA